MARPRDFRHVLPPRSRFPGSADQGALRYPRAVHYVGFRDDRYWSAFRVFGGPRVIHRWWDERARREIGADDLVVFADGPADQAPRRHNAPDIDEAFLLPAPTRPVHGRGA